MVKKCRSLEERLRLYKEVIRLRGLGLGYKRIARIIEKRYGVSLNPGMICKWINGKQHPLGNCNKILEGPGLAYVISAWLGDGSLARGKVRDNYGYYVNLRVTDYDFAEEWGRRLAEALGKSKPYVPRWNKSNQIWVVRASSELLYNLLKRAKEDPWIVMPYLEKYPREACRGFFDAEGSVNCNHYYIVACNTNRRIINLFEELLTKLGIDCRTYQRRKNDKFIIYLTILGKENILKFAEEVGFTIARKRLELQRLLQKYNSLKISKNRFEKCARVIIATNLVRLGFVQKQIVAAMILLISRSRICEYLHNKVGLSRFLRLPEIEELSKEYFHTRSDEIIKKVQKILEAISEIYNGQ